MANTRESLAAVHPKSIPGALKVHQDAIAKMQRTLRQELSKLQAEETILKLMIKRERKRLAKQAVQNEKEQQHVQPGSADAAVDVGDGRAGVD